MNLIVFGVVEIFINKNIEALECLVMCLTGSIADIRFISFWLLRPFYKKLSYEIVAD